MKEKLIEEVNTMCLPENLPENATVEPWIQKYALSVIEWLPDGITKPLIKVEISEMVKPECNAIGYFRGRGGMPCFYETVAGLYQDQNLERRKHLKDRGIPLPPLPLESSVESELEYKALLDSVYRKADLYPPLFREYETDTELLGCIHFTWKNGKKYGNSESHDFHINIDTTCKKNSPDRTLDVCIQAILLYAPGGVSEEGFGSILSYEEEVKKDVSGYLTENFKQMRYY